MGQWVKETHLALDGPVKLVEKTLGIGRETALVLKEGQGCPSPTWPLRKVQTMRVDSAQGNLQGSYTRVS